MSVANPMALMWAGLVVPIIILYILKIRLRRVPVSTILFWQQVFEENQPRSIWQRLRHLLSLLVNLALLLLLVGALAEPFFQWEVLQAKRMVLILDNSASMNAVDVEPTRLEKARELGRELIESLRIRDELAVISAGGRPRVVSGLSSHHRSLYQALDSIQATDSPTRAAEAIQLARRVLADQENASIVLLSDGCFADVEELTKGDDVNWVRVGTDLDNVGIASFQVRRSLVDPVGYEILAEVVNQSDEAVECRLELELEGQIADVIPLSLDANGSWSDVFTNTSSGGGVLVARLTHEDQFPTDNTARAVLPRRTAVPIILVTEGNLFLQKVFEANPLVDLTVTEDVPERAPSGGILVLHRKAPQTIPPGDVFVIEPTTSCDVWDAGDVLENPIVTKVDEASPLMTHIRLNNVLMPEARKLTVKDKANVLVEAVTGDALYFTVNRAQGKLLVLTVNLDRGDLPLRTAFPIMVANALAWFHGAKGELRPALGTGTVAEVELPPGLSKAIEDSSDDAASGLVLVGPDGKQTRLASTESPVAVGPLQYAGVWQLKPSASKSEEQSATEPILNLACNLANAEESDLRSTGEEMTQAELVRAGFGGRPVWFYLLAAALVLAAAEWWLYQRRWVG